MLQSLDPICQLSDSKKTTCKKHINVLYTIIYLIPIVYFIRIACATIVNFQLFLPNVCVQNRPKCRTARATNRWEFWIQEDMYGGPGGRATKHCTTSGFLIEQYSDGPIPCSSNGAAIRFCDRSHSAIKRSSTSATALTSIDLFLGSNNGLYLGSNNGLFLRSNSGPFLRPTSQTYYGIQRWYLA